MARTKKKEPPETPISDGSNVKIDNSLEVNSNTNPLENQVGVDSEWNHTQDFQQDETKYALTCDTKAKGTHWLFVVYPESAPADWQEQLQNTGIPFAVSDLHDRDVNPDGSKKKAHWHVIVSYDNSVRYSAAAGLRAITHGPYPLQCQSVSGAYAYFTHKHNPEKYQYDGAGIKLYNGWSKSLEASEISVIKRELVKMCLLDDLREYAELVVAAMEMGTDYESVAVNNTVFFVGFLRSYRHEPLRALKRFITTLENPEEQKLIAERIRGVEKQRASETAPNRKEN